MLVRSTTGPLHTLDGPAVEVWEALEPAATVHEIVVRLAPRYTVAEVVIRTDVVALVETLVAAGLVVAQLAPPVPVALA